MANKRSPDNLALGKAIREVREARDFTQEGFAGTVGLDRSYYGAVERADFNITIETLMTIARGLDVKASTLFTRAGL